MSPYNDAWKAAYGDNCEMPFGRDAQALKDLEQKFGGEEVLRRWKVMLARKTVDFAGAYLLKRGWDQYAPKARAVASSRARAEKFYAFLRRHGVDTTSGWFAKLSEVLGDERTLQFMALLNRCDRDLLKNAREAEWAIRHIEDRIGAELLSG